MSPSLHSAPGVLNKRTRSTTLDLNRDILQFHGDLTELHLPSAGIQVWFGRSIGLDFATTVLN